MLYISVVWRWHPTVETCNHYNWIASTVKCCVRCYQHNIYYMIDIQRYVKYKIGSIKTEHFLIQPCSQRMAGWTFRSTLDWNPGTSGTVTTILWSCTSRVLRVLWGTCENQGVCCESTQYPASWRANRHCMQRDHTIKSSHRSLGPAKTFVHLRHCEWFIYWPYFVTDVSKLQYCLWFQTYRTFYTKGLQLNSVLEIYAKRCLPNLSVVSIDPNMTPTLQEVQLRTLSVHS
jgi:hypothetical protein